MRYHSAIRTFFQNSSNFPSKSAQKMQHILQIPSHFSCFIVVINVLVCVYVIIPIITKCVCVCAGVPEGSYDPEWSVCDLERMD